MKAVTLVDLDRDGTHHFRQLTGSLATNHIHLKKSILTMRKTCRERQVDAIARRDRRNAGSISLDGRNSGKPGRQYFAAHLRKACE